MAKFLGGDFMIGYLCKYTPIHIIQSFGEYTYKLNPQIHTFNKCNYLTHNNMCSYVKAVIEECYEKNIDKIVLVNCCDSIRRLYDIMKNDPLFKFVYLIDMPRKLNNNSYRLFNNEVFKFISSLENHLHKPFSIECFLKALDAEKNINTQSFKEIPKNTLLIAGARLENYLLKTIKSKGYSIFDITCTNNQSILNETLALKNSLTSSKESLTLSQETLIMNYCKDILNQFPCMRMCDINERYNLIEKNKENIKGIIYHTIKFCDYYSFDYTYFKNNIDIPILKIDTDFLIQSEGQIKTRLEAFAESLKLQNINGGIEKTVNTKKHIVTIKKNITTTEELMASTKDSNAFFAGIDSGSTSTNVVIVDCQGNIISYSVVRTGPKSIDGAKKSLNEALYKCNLSKEDLKYIVSTGYGRGNIPFSQEAVTEITCHAKGVHHLKKDVRTVIDIGGQDSKVIKLDENGNVKDFAMNDKCAAGTGRFLENMCKILDIPIEDIGSHYLKWNKDLTITSMCTVFAESEVVSLIAENQETANIVHGLCKSVSTRVLSLVNRVQKSGEIMMTGGVAKNIGIVKSLEALTDQNIFVPEEPQIVGALGAALFAKEIFFSNH